MKVGWLRASLLPPKWISLDEDVAEVVSCDQPTGLAIEGTIRMNLENSEQAGTRGIGQLELPVRCDNVQLDLLSWNPVGRWNGRRVYLLPADDKLLSRNRLMRCVENRQYDRRFARPVTRLPGNSIPTVETSRLRALAYAVKVQSQLAAR